MPNPENFVIRVYGIIINERDEVLITDEYQLGMRMTKFPGGGLIFGEGPVECLQREFREECNGQELEKINHFYTTDFYQKALFYENHQLISIYYTAILKPPVRFTISEKPFNFDSAENGSQSFRWIKAENLNVSEISFPIDKLVAGKLVRAAKSRTSPFL